MKKIIILFTIVAMIFSSCKKSSDENPQPTRELHTYNFWIYWDPINSDINNTLIDTPYVYVNGNLTNILGIDYLPVKENDIINVKIKNINYFIAGHDSIQIPESDGYIRDTLFNLDWTYTVK